MHVRSRCRQHRPSGEVAEVLAYLQREKSAAGKLVGHPDAVRGQAAVLGALMASALTGEGRPAVRSAAGCLLLSC